MLGALMHSAHPQSMKLIFLFHVYHVKFFLDPRPFASLHRWPPDAVYAFAVRRVYFTLISRLWHSEGRAAQTEHVNIWASVFWVRDLFRLPSVWAWRSSAGISPQIFDSRFTRHCHCAGDWSESKFCFRKSKFHVLCPAQTFTLRKPNSHHVRGQNGPRLAPGHLGFLPANSRSRQMCGYREENESC